MLLPSIRACEPKIVYILSGVIGEYGEIGRARAHCGPLDRYTLGTDPSFPRTNSADDGYANSVALEKLVSSRDTIINCILVAYCKIVIICNYLVCYTMGFSTLERRHVSFILARAPQARWFSSIYHHGPRF